jgi:hypothetical protein
VFEALVLGGGGVLQTASSQRSFYYYVGVLMVAWMCRKKLWFLAQGIGPVSGWVSRTVLGFLVNQVDFVSVRDRQSKKILLGNDRVQQGADISLYRAPSYKAQALDSGQVGVCFCSEVHADSHVEVMRVLTQMGLGVRGYCFYPEQDLSLFDAAGVCEANKIALTEESFYLPQTPQPRQTKTNAVQDKNNIPEHPSPSESKHASPQHENPHVPLSKNKPPPAHYPKPGLYKTVPDTN